MHTIGLIFNPRLAASLPLAQEITAWLATRGVTAWLCCSDPQPTTQAVAEPTDLLVTLGGDGTILRAIHLAAPLQIPVLGINLGRVGFLTEARPEVWVSVLTQVLEDRGWLEERTLLRATLLRGGQSLGQRDALNDAVISRGALARTVRLETWVDGAPLTRYVADGLILATATGSTAYAYAVGGPVLPPWLDNLLLVPVAPHLTLDRPLVLEAGAVVEVIVHTTLPGLLSTDGQLVGELWDGDCVRVERSPLVAYFLRLRTRDDFYRTLVDRLTPRNEEFALITRP